MGGATHRAVRLHGACAGAPPPAQALRGCTTLLATAAGTRARRMERAHAASAACRPRCREHRRTPAAVCAAAARFRGVGPQHVDSQQERPWRRERPHQLHLGGFYAARHRAGWRPALAAGGLATGETLQAMASATLRLPFFLVPRGEHRGAPLQDSLRARQERVSTSTCAQGRCCPGRNAQE
jgi:hypothetical protein